MESLGNSTRRRRSSSNGDSFPVRVEIPIPVCVTLYHFFPHPEGVAVVHPQQEDSQSAATATATESALLSTTKATSAATTSTPAIISTSLFSSAPRWYRLPEHSKRLLRYPVRLEILNDDRVVLYSSVHQGGMIHPSWDLLDERFQWEVPNEELETSKNNTNTAASLKDCNQSNNIWKETYRSLSVRISLVQSGSSETDTTQPAQNPTMVLAEAPLNPTSLQRLDPRTFSSSLTSSSALNSDSFQGPQQLLPVALPPNSLVVFFSDGSIRVSLQLYQFLLERHVLLDYKSNTTLSATSKTSTGAANTNALVEDFDRFSDDVFATLDQVKPTTTTTSSNSDKTTLTTTFSPIPTAKPRNDVSLLETDDEHVDDVLNEDDESEDRTSPCPQLIEEDDENVTSYSQYEEQLIVLEDLRQEQRELQHLFDEEEKAFKQELKQLQEEKSELQRLVSHSQTIQAETTRIREATYQEILSCQQAEFALEAQRIKLIMELHDLYPIQVKADQRYMIRGLEIPRDVHSAVVSEDEISAALGYLTHSVAMMSKYLAVPLRYRLYCSSSRSAISPDGRSAVFPLFTSRAVEREELDRALVLLHRNVDCLLQSRDIRCPPQTHILAKMQRIYNKIMDGC